MNIPIIKGTVDEDTIGELFQEWWSIRGLDNFIEFLNRRGIPVVDDPEAVKEEVVLTDMQKHEEFFKNG